MESQIALCRASTVDSTSHNCVICKSHKHQILLMTCRVLVDAPDGSSVEARAILDSASSASFVLEHLSQSLHLPCFRKGVQISGIAGLSHNSPLQAVPSFSISAVWSPLKIQGESCCCALCDV